MANFYNDNPDLKHHLTHPLMGKIVALKEREYADADKYDYAPQNFDDAMDNYDKVLEIVGDESLHMVRFVAEKIPERCYWLDSQIDIDKFYASLPLVRTRNVAFLNMIFLAIDSKYFNIMTAINQSSDNAVHCHRTAFACWIG